MSDNDRAAQAEQLIARMQAARGYIYPEWELAARTDPDFTEAYNRIYELALGEGRHVSAKESRQNNLSISLLNVLRLALCRTQHARLLQQSLSS